MASATRSSTEQQARAPASALSAQGIGSSSGSAQQHLQIVTDSVQPHAALKSPASDATEPHVAKRYKKIVGEPEWYRRMSIHPHSPLRVTWDSCSMVFLVYNAFAVPLRLCFDVTDYCPSNIWFFEATTDFFFVRVLRPPAPRQLPAVHARADSLKHSLCPQVADVFSNFFTAVIIEDSESASSQATPLAIARPRLVASMYLRSWFCLDFFSSLPVDLIASVAYYGCSGGTQGTGGITSIVKLLRVVKLVKLLKLMRLLKLSALLAELKDHYPIPEIAIKAVQMIGVIIFAGHVTACLWYLVGRNTYSYALLVREAAVQDGTAAATSLLPTVSWLQVAGLEPEDPLNQGLSWREALPPYVASIYWAFTTMTSTGYGDITPQSEGEQSRNHSDSVTQITYCVPLITLVRHHLCITSFLRVM